MGIYIGITIIFIIIVWVIIKNNKIIKLKNKVKQAESTIDVYLKQRFDLIPNLVECVKTYMQYEQETLQAIVEQRNEYMQKNINNWYEAAKLNSECNNIIIKAEQYPELKSSEQFLNLQKQLAKTENELQAARRFYNSNVTVYNTEIKTFPNNMVAGIFGHKEAELFEFEQNN